MKKRLLRIGLKITPASIYKIFAILWIFANRLAEVIFQRFLSGRLVRISVMVAVLLSACSHASASGYDANANLQTGDVYNAHFETVMDTTVNGAAQKSTEVSEMDMSLTVQNIDQDHNATIQCKFIAPTLSKPSKGGAPRRVFQLSNQLLAGKIFSAKVSSRGEVLEITGLDALVDQTVKGGTDGLDFHLEDVMKMLFATLDGHFPKQSVQVGDTWDDTVNMKMIVPITLKSKWKFVSDKDGILTVEGKGKMWVPKDQADIKIMGTDVDIKENWESDVEETLHMHKDHLFVQTGTRTEHSKGTIEMQNGGQTAKMLITVESKRTFEITKQ